MSIDSELPKKHRRRCATAPPIAPPSSKYRRFYMLGGISAGLLLLFTFAFALKSAPPLASTPLAVSIESPTVVQPSADRLLAVTIDPVAATPGTRLRAVVQPRGTLPEEIVYRWHRNSQPLDGAVGNELDTSALARNDAVAVSATRVINGSEKESVRSLAVVLRNRPPSIEPGRFGAVVDGRYMVDIEATDPDGDAITFALEKAPADMTIDSATGLISWNLPAGAEGIFEFQVSASDGTSAVLQNLKISLGDSL